MFPEYANAAQILRIKICVANTFDLTALLAGVNLFDLRINGKPLIQKKIILLQTNILKPKRCGCSLVMKEKFMNKKLMTALCICVVGLGSVNTGRASEDRSLDAIADVTLVRPGCFIATVVGSAFFVVALPFAAAAGSVKETANTLVVHPAQATFTRPVGDFTTLR